MIWLAAGVLAVAAGAAVCLPWWSRRFAQREGMQRRSANVVAYRTRIAEIDTEVAAGVMSAEAAGAARDEAAARLLEDTAATADRPASGPASAAVGILAALLLAAFAGGWYALAGSWRTQALVDLARMDPDAAREASLDQMVARLEAHVEAQPDDAEGWAWLGRTYRTQGRLLRAAEALGQANALSGTRDPDLLVEEGEVLAQLQDRSLAGPPAQRFDRALEAFPDHPRALWYAGLAALQAGDETTALRRWERLASQDVPQDVRTMLEHSVAELRRRTGAAPEQDGSGGVTLDLEVAIASGLASDLRPGDVLFVIARAEAGPRMPLAVRRLEAVGFPMRVRLDDSHSMTPARTLSSAEAWQVVARISRAGSAEARTGDLEGDARVSRAEAGKPVRLVIDRRVP